MLPAPARRCSYGFAQGIIRKPLMRIINAAAAQMGPIQKADSREAVVKRMIGLMDEAKAKGADLIVLGSHGYTGIKRLLLGSIALYVVSHAPCSVEVVRPQSEQI